MGERSLGRARLSCLPCRKRKSKCDEKIPCTSCILRNSSNRCQLPDASIIPGVRESVSQDYRADSTATKRRRLSNDAALDDPATASLEDIERVRESLDRLEGRIREQRDPLAYSLAHNKSPSAVANTSSPLPDRLKNLDEILSILPCQADCETLFEYTLQEADWMVNSIGVQWLEPIWCRFVYGARVTEAESMLLVGVLAVATLLLDEGPHIYYQTATPLGPLQSRLTDYLFRYISSLQSSTEAPSHPYTISDRRNSLNELLALAMAFDYLRLSGARMPEQWPLVRSVLYKMERSTPFLSKSDPIWQDLDEIETEYARRMAWHFIICERWSDLYENQSRGGSSPFCSGTVDIPQPRWICSSLSTPFRARPIGNCSDKAITMSAPPKNVARVFRIKDESEAEDVVLMARILTELSLHVSAAAGYIAAIESWRKECRRRGSSGFDHQKEALLHQSVVICNNIKEWQEQIKPYCAESRSLDPNDYLACRRASQIAIIHVGRRQILSAVLGAWVTEESIMEEGSPLLAQQQREAFNNARDAVKTIDVTRTLLSCGKILQIPWATLAFFTAATTLAIPLLAASKLRQRSDSEARSREDYPRVFRVDTLPGIDTMTTTPMSASPRPSLASVPFYPRSPIASPSVLSMDEMRTLAPDILLILELMPHYRPSFLSIEARQRLVKLVDTYGIGHSNSDLPPHEQKHHNNDSEAVALSFHHGDDVSETVEQSGYSVLDSLIALDDFWWDQLLASNDQGAMQTSSIA